MSNVWCWTLNTGKRYIDDDLADFYNYMYAHAIDTRKIPAHLLASIQILFSGKYRNGTCTEGPLGFAEHPSTRYNRFMLSEVLNL